MEIAGWLDVTRLYTTGSTSATFRLRPLHRRDLPGYLAAKVQFGLETLYVEFRTDDRWDAAIPRPCVLLHREAAHPSSGLPCSELVVARPDVASPENWLGEGHTYQVGDPADPFGFLAKLTVMSVDSAQQEATIVLAVDKSGPSSRRGCRLAGSRVTVEVWRRARGGFVRCVRDHHSSESWSMSQRSRRSPLSSSRATLGSCMRSHSTISCVCVTTFRR